MGRLSGGATELIFEGPDWVVYIWDPYMGKRIFPSGNEVITPTRIVNAPGPFGGMCEMEHTGYAFNQDFPDDSGKLLGAIIQIEIDGECKFAGTITGIKKRLSVDDNSGTESFILEARDVMHMLADKLLAVDFPYISSGGLAGVIGGGAYSYYRSKPSGRGGSLQVTQFDPPLLPCDKRGNPIVTISPIIINSGASSFPRRFSDSPQQINAVLSMICLEQKADMFYSMPSPIGKRGKLATIVSTEFGDDERPLVLGAPSDNDLENLRLLPIASSITVEEDYSGVVTQIDAIGGDITQSVFLSLVPAWNTQLDADVIANPKLVKDNESVYGAVGRVFTVGHHPFLYPFLPFRPEPGKRHAEQAFDQSGAQTVQQLTDGAAVYEFCQSEQSDDQSDDSLWRESQAAWTLMPYNDEMAGTGLINVRGKVKRDLAANRMNLIVFEEPQFQDFWVQEGPSYVKHTVVKPMYIEGMRVVARMGYSTGHVGSFPRPRLGMIFDRSWTAHRANYHTEDSSRERMRFIKNLDGLVSDAPSSPVSSRFDRSAVMQNEAEALVEQLSRPHYHASIEIQGISHEFKMGTTIPKIYDVDGTILKDELELVVRQIEYLRDNRTILHADMELVF